MHRSKRSLLQISTSSLRSPAKRSRQSPLIALIDFSRSSISSRRGDIPANSISFPQAAIEDIENASSTVKGWKARWKPNIFVQLASTNQFVQRTFIPFISCEPCRVLDKFDIRHQPKGEKRSRSKGEKEEKESS